MHKNLILISGSPCVGKSAVGIRLFESYDNSAYLDGDWCWCVHPFSTADQRLRNGDKSMSFVLSNYLDSDFEYVVFTSVVLTDARIREGILNGITAKEYRTISFTLTCSEETLKKRHDKRGDPGETNYYWLHLPPCQGDIVIDTDNKSVREIVREMKQYISMNDRAENLLLREVTQDDTTEVARTWPSDHRPILEAEAQEAISRMRRNYARNTDGCVYHLCLAVCLKDDPRTIMGWCGLDGSRSHTEPEIFILLDEAYRNQGIGTQCVRELLKIAAEDFSLRSVHGGCDKNNIASRRTMEKGGMVQYGKEENGDPLFRYSV